MNRIRVVIVDDEPLARERIARLLEPHDDIEIIAEAGDGEEALRITRELAPDLVLLDIQMPEIDGIEVASRIDARPGRKPAIIFLTAHDEHALEAFESAAIDYVLKPVDPERIAKSLDRLRDRIRSGTDLDDQALASFIAGFRRTGDRPSRFVVRKTRGRRVVVTIDQIHWVGAERNYVRLYTKNGKHLHRETMSGMMKHLDPEAFVRIHRSTIVRIDEISEIDSESDGNIFIRTRNGERLSVGQSYRADLEAALGYRIR